MKNCPTDLSDNQWQFIKKTLQLDDRKRKHGLRFIWDAIYYLLKTRCQWRMLPLNFAKWQLVYYYYKKWSDLEQFDLLLSKLREHIRVKKGQNAEVSLGVLDSQSVR
jgi:transposase